MDRRSLLTGTVVGLLLGAGAVYAFLRGPGLPRVYTVRSISSHYPHQNEDSQTTLLVYRSGDSGHVQEVLCHFPPGLQLPVDDQGQWTGIHHVRIGGVAQTYMFGEVGYLCEAVD